MLTAGIVVLMSRSAGLAVWMPTEEATHPPRRCQAVECSLNNGLQSLPLGSILIVLPSSQQILKAPSLLEWHKTDALNLA